MSFFKKGSKYSREIISRAYFPQGGQHSRGGEWDTGYINPKNTNDLVVFMNIGIAGRVSDKEWDFDNQYDEKTGLVIWYGKPNRSSSTPQIQKIINNKFEAIHFFARWSHGDDFTYLGVGYVIDYEDGAPVKGKDSTSVEFKVVIRDVAEILPQLETSEISTFAYEKQLENFLEDNWEETIFGDEYDIYEKDGKHGRQFPTGIGPIDLLAISKDSSKFLVIELKRDKAKEAVIGQTAKYITWIEENLASKEQEVKGCIVASEKSSGLSYALQQFPKIEFFKYALNFSLEADNS